MKKLMILFLLLFLTAHSEEITYESLESNDYTWHVKNFRVFFDKIHVRHFLEFGLGRGTKYFLDNCDEVTSVEILVPGMSKNWYLQCLEMFEYYQNWKPSFYMGSDSLGKANHVRLYEGKDFALSDAAYLTELQALCDLIFSTKTYELVFVDPGIYLRGDLINMLFGKTDIIAAHDTNTVATLYGWDKIKVPQEYEVVKFTNRTGLTFWVKKNRTEVISVLKEMLYLNNTSVTN
jgi:hypothetical protein